MRVGSLPTGVSPVILQMLFMTPFWKHLERPWHCLSPRQMAFGELMVMLGIRTTHDTDLLLGKVAIGLS